MDNKREICIVCGGIPVPGKQLCGYHDEEREELRKYNREIAAEVKRVAELRRQIAKGRTP